VRALPPGTPNPVTPSAFDADRWVAALLDRHLAALHRPEFLKAVRALSVRYVERRHALVDRSPLDSAGKRAAFAAFYAPLHFLTMRAILQALRDATSPVDRVTDLGCGTGVTGAAWALENPTPVDLTGVDRHPWALGEARWNWREMGLRGRAVRSDLGQWLSNASEARAGAPLARHGIVMAWSMNELPDQARQRVQDALIDLVSRGANVLVVEPVSRRLVPWWDDWASRVVDVGGRADEWRFDGPLPPALAALDEAAGFGRDALTARSVLASPLSWTKPR
jgi:hypothetical protein